MEELLQLYSNNELQIAEVEKQISLAVADLQNKQQELTSKNEELKEQISYWFDAEHFNSSDFEDGNHVILNVSLVEPINDSFKTVMEFMR